MKESKLAQAIKKLIELRYDLSYDESFSKSLSKKDAREKFGVYYAEIGEILSLLDPKFRKAIRIRVKLGEEGEAP